MPQTRNRGARGSVVKNDTVGQVAGFLGDLPAKAKDQISLKEAIVHLAEPIQSVLVKGYSYEEIATMLSEHGVPISPHTLKSYVPRGKQRSAGKKVGSTKRSAKSKAADATIQPTQPATPTVQEPVQPEAEPATPKRKTTRATSKSSTAQKPTRKTAAKAAPIAKTTTARKATGTTTRQRKTS